LSIVFALERTNQLSLLPDKDLVDLCPPIEPYQVTKNQNHHIERMIELMDRYANLPMDMADASLIVLAEHLGHGRILTVDRRDFSIYRWNNTEVFNNLL
jgi:predicted nucleic acid-binding protein